MPWQTPAVQTDDAVVDESLTVGFAPLEIGQNASATGLDTVVIGQEATDNGQERHTVIGGGAVGQPNSREGVAVGHDSAVNFKSVAVGSSADAGENQAVAVGFETEVISNFGTAVGTDAVADFHSVAIGHNASTAGDYQTAFGDSTTVSARRGIALGADTTVATQDVCRVGVEQLVHGGTRDTIADADLNNGELTVELDESNSAFRLRGKDSGGTIREATIAW